MKNGIPLVITHIFHGILPEINHPASLGYPHCTGLDPSPMMDQTSVRHRDALAAGGTSHTLGLAKSGEKKLKNRFRRGKRKKDRDKESFEWRINGSIQMYLPQK